MLMVREHVLQGALHRRGVLEAALVIAIGEEAPAGAHHLVDALRDSDLEGADTIGHRAAVVGLEEQVEMIAEHSELHHAEAIAKADSTDGALNRPEATLAT